jgi:hypothetical protein
MSRRVSVNLSPDKRRSRSGAAADGQFCPSATDRYQIRNQCLVPNQLLPAPGGRCSFEQNSINWTPSSPEPLNSKSRIFIPPVYATETRDSPQGRRLRLPRRADADIARTMRLPA